MEKEKNDYFFTFPILLFVFICTVIIIGAYIYFINSGGSCSVSPGLEVLGIIGRFLSGFLQMIVSGIGNFINDLYSSLANTAHHVFAFSTGFFNKFDNTNIVVHPASGRSVAMDNRGYDVWDRLIESFGGILNLIFFIVGIVVLLAVSLRLAATRTHVAPSCRPVLIFKHVIETRTLHVVNKGNGPATNICLIIWHDLVLNATSTKDVPCIRTSAEAALTFPIDKCLPTDVNELRERFISISEFPTFIKRVIHTKHNLICLIYRDVNGEWFYSMISSATDMDVNCENTFEYGSLK